MAVEFLPLQFIPGAFHILSTSVLGVNFFEYVRDTYILRIEI